MYKIRCHNILSKHILMKLNQLLIFMKYKFDLKIYYENMLCKAVK